MYAIFSKNRTIERSFDKLIDILEESEKKKLMTSLAKYPKSLPVSSKTEKIGRIEKKGKFWQYYAPEGCRIIYDVRDRPKEVIIQFAGDHEEAQIWLRQNVRRR